MTKRARILVVEDEAIVAEDLKEMLAGLGYGVLGPVARTDRAIELAIVEAPDLVLMDVRLDGDVDGITAAAHIRRECGIPVVFLTAYADELTLERAKAAEPFGYLVKPVQEQVLNATVRLACHRQKVERDRLSQARLQRIIDDLGGGFYQLDFEMRFTEVSPAAERLLGLPRERILGRSLPELFPELHESAIGDELQRVIESGTEGVLETYHLPARLRVRLYMQPEDGRVNVFYFARSPN